MDLMAANTGAESDAVIDHFNRQDDSNSWNDLWIGGRDLTTQAQFRWVRDSSLVATDRAARGSGLNGRWESGEPNSGNNGANNDCVSVYQSSNRWDDRPCSGGQEFICEYQ
jgi:hypothetical protein